MDGWMDGCITGLTGRQIDGLIDMQKNCFTLYYTVLYCTVLHVIALFCIVRHCQDQNFIKDSKSDLVTFQYNTIQYKCV